MLRYGRPSGFRAHVEAVVTRVGLARPRPCGRLVDCGGRDALVDRVPDLAPGWTRPSTARREFRDRVARAKCACVPPRPSPVRQGRAFGPLRQSRGFPQGLSSWLVAGLSWRLPASDGPGVSVRLPGSGRRLALASAAALTYSAWVAKGKRDPLSMARLNGSSCRSNPPPSLLSSFRQRAMASSVPPRAACSDAVLTRVRLARYWFVAAVRPLSP
jgi:hypothetical protein